VVLWVVCGRYFFYHRDHRGTQRAGTAKGIYREGREGTRREAGEDGRQEDGRKGGRRREEGRQETGGRETGGRETGKRESRKQERHFAIATGSDPDKPIIFQSFLLKSTCF